MTISSIDTGASNITTLGTVTTGTWSATPFTLAQSGLGQSNTASNGGIVYSTAAVLTVLAGTATAGQMLLSGASTTPAWSTTTWPSTVTTTSLLYASAANVVSALAPSNSSVLCSDLNGIPIWITLTNGQLIIGSTGATPVAANLIGTNGIGITNGAGAITIAANPPTDANSSSITMTAGGYYLCDNGSNLITFTLPSSPVAGDFYTIVGASSGGWTVAQNASQLIQLPGGGVTTTGVSGSLSSNSQYDCVVIMFTEIANTFSAPSIIGNIIYV